MGYVTVFSTSFASGILTFYTKSGVGIDHLYTLVEFLSGMYLPLQFSLDGLGPSPSGCRSRRFTTSYGHMERYDGPEKSFRP